MIEEDLMQKQISKPKKQDQTEPPAPRSKASTTGEALKEEIDDLLDEIDGILEHNAEAFVKSYVQRGGE